MKRLGFSLLFFVALAVRLDAATNIAASASLADATAALGLCANGDTLAIPAGTATWSSQLSVTKAVTIRGAGTNSTIITGRAFALNPGVDLPTRITQIQFVQPAGDWSTEGIINAIGPCYQYRVDHCLFIRGKRACFFGGNGSRGAPVGVVDHNVFFNVNISCYVSDNRGGDSSDGDQAWAEKVGPGTMGNTNCVVMEDNAIYWDSLISDGANNNNEVLYGWYGGRAVFRFNNCTNSGDGMAGLVDAHGGRTSQRGTMQFEVYSNSFSMGTGQYWFLNLRGGSHLVFGNTFTKRGGAMPVIQLRQEDTGPRDLITNCFFWNNTFQGAAVTASGVSVTSGGFAENADWFMRAPQSGNAFYPYTPLAYPHPLVTARDGQPENAEPPAQPSASFIKSANVGVLRFLK